jgi:hypothetical protein
MIGTVDVAVHLARVAQQSQNFLAMHHPLDTGLQADEQGAGHYQLQNAF